MSESDSDEDAFFDAVESHPNDAYAIRPELSRGGAHFVRDHISCRVPFSSFGGGDIVEEDTPVEVNGEDDLLINSRPLFPIAPRKNTTNTKSSQRTSEILSRAVEVDKMRAQLLGEPTKKRISADATQLGRTSSRGLSQGPTPPSSPNMSPKGVRSPASMSVVISQIPEEAEVRHTDPSDHSPTHSDTSITSTPTTATTGTETPPPKDTNVRGGMGVMNRLRKVLFLPTAPPGTPTSHQGSPQPPLQSHAAHTATPTRKDAISGMSLGGPALGKRASAPAVEGVKMGQILTGHRGPVWAVEFSPCGHFLASAGRDTRVLVWSVGVERRGLLDTDTDPRAGGGSKERHSSCRSEDSAEDSSSLTSDNMSTTMAIINPTPYRVYTDHTDDVVDLAWTKTCFLLSASTDKTVRLWNVHKYVYVYSMLLTGQ